MARDCPETERAALWEMEIAARRAWLERQYHQLDHHRLALDRIRDNLMVKEAGRRTLVGASKRRSSLWVGQQRIERAESSSVA